MSKRTLLVAPLLLAVVSCTLPMSLSSPGLQPSPKPAASTIYVSDVIVTGERGHVRPLESFGFFALSKVPSPKTLADLIFTRRGTFVLEREPSRALIHSEDLEKVSDAETGYWRLRSQDGYAVMGMRKFPEFRPFEEEPRLEESLAAFAELPTSDSGSKAIGLRPIVYPYIRKQDDPSLDCNARLGEDFFFPPLSTAMYLLSTGNAPLSSIDFESSGFIAVEATQSLAGSRRGAVVKHLAIVDFPNPEALHRLDANAFAWMPEAGLPTVGNFGTWHDVGSGPMRVDPGLYEVWKPLAL